MNTPIVVLCYNRPDSLNRILSSLTKSAIEQNVSLIISIDYQNSILHKKVKEIASNYQWPFGEKIIIEHKENLGLKKHVISCGDLSVKYGSVIILEDDLIVSPYLYDYTQHALNKYENESLIAGISLYSFEWNQIADRAFTPAQEGHDIYFMMMPISWGQVWSKKMWLNFKKWYDEYKSASFLEMNTIPENVKKWSKYSWLKYQVAYCIEQQKYYVYPYISLTTNFTDLGQHVKKPQGIYQVPLLNGKKIYTHLPESNMAIKYDGFYERENLGKVMGIDESQLCIDLYGQKRNKLKKQYWLTSSVENYKIIKSFALQIKPHELNIINNINGDEIFLYDTFLKEKKMHHKFKIEAKKILYDINEVPLFKLLIVITYKILRRLTILK